MLEPTVIEFTCVGKDFKFLMLLDPNDPSDKDTMNEYTLSNNYQTDITRVMARAIRPGDRVIDGGANVGFYTLLMAQLVGPSGEVVAYEPNPYNVEKIKCNIKLNGFTHVDVRGQALWAAKTTKTFYVSDHNAWGSLLSEPLFGQGQTRPVPNIVTATLNDVSPPVRFIKLDIEGAEMPALCGASRHIVNHACPFIVCEVNDFAHRVLQTDQFVLAGMMRAHGYDVFLIYRDEDGCDLVPEGAYTYALNGQPGIYNILFSTQEAINAF